MGKGSKVDTRVARTTAATTFEDESVKVAGDNTRRRLAAANSRDKSNSFWTSLLSTNQQNGSGGKNTLG